MAEPQRFRERAMVWWPAVAALERLLEAVTATAVTVAWQTPPAAAVGELSAALRQIADAVRSASPVRPEGRPSEPPRLKPVIDAVSSLTDALGTMPQQRQQLRIPPDAAA
jgi:hypothetical protein